jgi:hypothetical protein
MAFILAAFRLAGVAVVVVGVDAGAGAITAGGAFVIGGVFVETGVVAVAGIFVIVGAVAGAGSFVVSRAVAGTGLFVGAAETAAIGVSLVPAVFAIAASSALDVSEQATPTMTIARPARKNVGRLGLKRISTCVLNVEQVV